MQRRSLKAGLLASLALGLLSGCLSLGADKISPEPARYQLQACSAAQPLQQSAQDTGWQLRFLGPAAPLATAKTLWGSTLRYVIPYTRHTELYELKVSNTSKQVLWVDPGAVSLQQNGQNLSPLGMDFFERAWPAGAVASEAQMIDRSLAISEVIRTLFVKRPLEPGESYTAILPFLRKDEQPPNSLKIAGWQREQEAIGTEFCLSWKPGK